MKSKLKIMTIVGTRPELIKMSRIIAEFEKYTNHILVHSGQNYDYELNEIFFNDLGLKKPDYFLNAVGKTVADSIGQIISKSDDVFEKEKPDAIVIYGDTNSGLSVIPAKRRKIPIFHLEGGILKYFEEVGDEFSWRGECFVFDNRVSINTKLKKGSFKLCYACRMPISQNDMKSIKYIKGISCPSCYGSKTDKQINKYRTRNNQFEDKHDA